MKLRVECYSGHKANERPIRFQLNGHDYFVEQVLDQWYGLDDVYFKLRADDGNLYILRHSTSAREGEWSLEAYRQGSAKTSRASG